LVNQNTIPKAEAMAVFKRAGFPAEVIDEIASQLSDPVDVDRDSSLLLRLGLRGTSWPTAWEAALNAVEQCCAQVRSPPGTAGAAGRAPVRWREERLGTVARVDPSPVGR